MIELKEIGYRYKRGHNVLDGITMTFKPGHIYGLLGKNGVGKSTLLKIISGLLRPEGVCKVNGRIPFDRQQAFLEEVVFIPETPYVADMSIGKLVAITAPFYKNFDYELLERMLTEFEVPRDSSLQQMSLGQQKKALIVLAIACNTPFLLMDEPINGLDIPSKSIFRRVIASIADENRTILISTHQVRDLENLIDSVVILETDGVLLDTNLPEIEERLSFRELLPGEMALYTEKTVRGVRGVIEIDRTDLEPESGNVDLELLFNAVSSNKERIRALFEKSEKL